MPDTHAPSQARGAVLLAAIGRQRVGKTALLNALVQHCRGMGSELVVLNADQQNNTHSLSTFFPDARVPPPGSLMDNRAWIEGEIVRMAHGGYDAVLDAGGGWTGFASLIEEVPLQESLEATGVKLIGLVCVGTEQADLDYLSRNLDNGTFRPEATMIVLNSGLITSGRSANGAFSSVVRHPAVIAAANAGAKIAVMPALACMAEVTDRSISFADAAEGRVRPGQPPMSLFDPVRVREWWTKKMPAFFGEFPAGWLPAGPASSRDALAATPAGAA